MKSSQLKFGIVLSYVSLGINMVVQLLYTPIMIRLLGTSEYGVYTLVGSVVSYLSLFSLGFTGAYLRFYSRFHARDDRVAVARLNGMFLTLFLFMSLLAFTCGMILSQFTTQLFGTKLTPAELKISKVLMQILVCNIALSFPSAVFDSIISAHEQFIFQRLLTLAGSIFNPLISLPLLLMGYGSVAMVTVTTLISIAKLAANIVFCFKKLHVHFSFRHFNIALLKEIASFSFFLFLNMVIDQINWSADKFILGRVSGTAAVAVYGVGAQINTIYLNFSTVISSVFSPRINYIAAKKDTSMLQDFSSLFLKVGRIQFLVLALVASGFVVFGHFFIADIYAGPEYAEAYSVTLWLILPAIIPLIQNLGIEIQRSLNLHQFRSIIYLLMAIANVIISIPMGKQFGAVGCAIGTAISLLIANGLIINIYYHKVIKLDIRAFWKSIFWMAKGLLLPCLFGYVIMRFVLFNSLIDFLGWILAYIVVYIVSIWFFSMNPEEKGFFVRTISNIFKKTK